MARYNIYNRSGNLPEVIVVSDDYKVYVLDDGEIINYGRTISNSKEISSTWPESLEGAVEEYNTMTNYYKIDKISVNTIKTKMALCVLGS